MKNLSFFIVVLFIFFASASIEAQEILSKRKTLEISIQADDAEENVANGTVSLSNKSLALGTNYIGLRFSNFILPVNAIVDSAYLQFHSQNRNTAKSNLIIIGEAAIDSTPFSNTPYNLSSRKKTGANVAWAVPEWTWGEKGLKQRSPDISSIIREIANQEGFSSSSPLTLFIEGVGARSAQSFDGNPSTSPTLLIQYRDPNALSDTSPYKDRYKDYFSIGTETAVSRLGYFQYLDKYNIFNRVTAEYEMKWKVIQPQYDNFDFNRSDAISNYARDNSMKMTGHAFLWHQENPDWLFKNGPDGAISASTLSSRLKKHIYKIVQRYGDVVDNWDVVNEAISPSSDEGKIYRDTAEGSQWWSVFQSPEFIKLAFQYAAEANFAYGYNAKLFYNDYDVPNPVKLNKIFTMVDYLRAEGVPIDGIGFQGHWTLNDHSLKAIRTAFDKVIGKGLKIKISELDISISNIHYNNNPDYPRPFTEAAFQEQAYRYQELFDLFREYKEHIHSVTFWGISDKDSWLNKDWNTWETLPLSQQDAPLLFDGNFNPKKAFFSIMDFPREQQLLAVIQAEPKSGTAPLSVSFDASSSSGTVTEYHWNLGDGTESKEMKVTHTYNEADTYTVVLTVKNDKNNISTASESIVVDITPDNPPVTPSPDAIYVKDISILLTPAKNRNFTDVQATVLVHNGAKEAVAGVTVSGTWSGLVSGTVSGTTDSEGMVKFMANPLQKNREGIVTFTVDNLSKTDAEYDSSQNVMTETSVSLPLRDTVTRNATR